MKLKELLVKNDIELLETAHYGIKIEIKNFSKYPLAT